MAPNFVDGIKLFKGVYHSRQVSVEVLFEIIVVAITLGSTNNNVINHC